MKNPAFMHPETARNLLALSRARRALSQVKRHEANAFHSHKLFRNAIVAKRLALQQIIFELETALGLRSAEEIRINQLWKGVRNHA